MTFDALRRQVLRQLDEEDDALTTKQLAEDYLNQAHQLWCMQPRMKGFLISPRESALQVVAGQRRYALPVTCSKLLYLRTEEGQRLPEVPARSTPEEMAESFAYWGYWPVRKQPPQGGSVLSVLSTNALDAGSVVIKGIDPDGEPVRETLDIDGTTLVVGTQVFQDVLNVTKLVEIAGHMTLWAGAEQLLKLGPTEAGKQFRCVELHWTPTEAQTLYERHFLSPRMLIEDHDVPEIPAPFSMGLVWEALLMFAGYNTDMGRVTEWRDLRDSWANALDRYLWESDTLGAEGLYVHKARR
jgi:hypothetical protein